MYTYALMVFLLKHYYFRKQQIWHWVKLLNWPFPTPFPFPQHLPARCLSPLQRRSHLAGLGCFWCFPSHLLLFPFSCTSAGSDFALHRHRGCPQRNRLFILGAAQPPLGSLPAAEIFFLPGKGCYYPVATNAKWHLSALPEPPASFAPRQTGTKRGPTWMTACLALFSPKKFMHKHQYFKPVDCSHRCPQTSHSSAIPWFFTSHPANARTHQPWSARPGTPLSLWHSQKHHPAPPAPHGSILEFPSTTSSMFKSWSRKPGHQGPSTQQGQILTVVWKKFIHLQGTS